jgi:ribosomal protein L40E
LPLYAYDLHELRGRQALRPETNRPVSVGEPSERTVAKPAAPAAGIKIQRKTSSLLILVVIFVAPLVGLVYYLVTPSVLIFYTATSYSPAVSVSTSATTSFYYSTASIGSCSTTYMTQLVGSACLGYAGSSCASWVYNTRRVQTTGIIPIYETTTIKTSHTMLHTTTSTKILTSTMSTHTVPEDGTTAAIVAVSSIIIGALLVYAIAFRNRQPRQPPPVKAIEPEPPKSISQKGLDTKFCRECGAKIPRDSTFCEECGAKLA